MKANIPLLALGLLALGGSSFLNGAVTADAMNDGDAIFTQTLSQGDASLQVLLSKTRAEWGKDHAAAPAFKDTHDMAACIRNPDCHYTFVVAHRGLGFGQPENSRATVTAALMNGIQIIETDLRISKDGEVVILHDANLFRTTSYKAIKGKPEEMTWEELSRITLKGNGEALPRFQDLYELTRGKALLNLHMKSNSVEQMANWINGYGSFDDVIFFLENEDLMRTAALMKVKYPAMIAMAREHSKNGGLAAIQGIFGGRLPEIVHTDIPDQELADQIHAGGSKIFANLLREEKIPFMGDPTLRKLLNRGVDFIQTEDPRKVKKEVGRAQARVAELHD